MKPKIHPKWFPQAKVVCACGNAFTVGATVPELSTEVCSSCHPFFTGEQRIVDTAGQVDRFMRRLEAGVQHRQADRQRKLTKAEAEREAKRKRRGLEPIRARTAKAAAKPKAEASAEASAGASAEHAEPAAEAEATEAAQSE